MKERVHPLSAQTFPGVGPLRKGHFEEIATSIYALECDVTVADLCREKNEAGPEMGHTFVDSSFKSISTLQGSMADMHTPDAVIYTPKSSIKVF